MINHFRLSRRLVIWILLTFPSVTFCLQRLRSRSQKFMWWSITGRYHSISDCLVPRLYAKKIHFLLPVFNFPRYLLEGTKICCQVKILISSSVFTYFKLKAISTYGEISRYNTVHMAWNRHHDSESVKACLFLENRCYCKNVATCKNFRL